jgi:hypothetical protein
MELDGGVYSSDQGVIAPANGVGHHVTHPKFLQGDIVTFILDLTCSGSLHAYVNGGAPFTLFTGMASNFEDVNGVGFISAVSLKQPGIVEFLGFF